MYYTKLRLASQDLVGLLHDREDLLASCRSMPLGAQLWAMTAVDRIEKEIEATLSRIPRLKKEEQKEEQKEEKKEDSEFIESRVFVSEDGIRIQVKNGDSWHTKWRITTDGDIRDCDAWNAQFQKESRKVKEITPKQETVDEKEIMTIFDQLLRLSIRDCEYLHKCLEDGRVRSVDGVKQFISKVGLAD